MNCDGCSIGSFKKDDAEQTGKPVTVNGQQIATTFGGATGGNPTWKTPGAPQSVFGLMAWSAFAWGGLCIDEGEHCEEIYGCGADLTLKFMLQVPTGGATNVTLTGPGGVVTPGTPRPLPGNATVDNYRIDFVIRMDAGCGTDTTTLLDDNWVVTINGVTATHHAASGDIKFELECESCEGADDADKV